MQDEMKKDQKAEINIESEEIDDPSKPVEIEENKEPVYDIEGVLIGAGIGAVLGALVPFQQMDLIFGAQIGALIGLIIGTRIKKDPSKVKKEDKDKNKENKENKENEIKTYK